MNKPRQISKVPKAPKSIKRCDLLRSPMNVGKSQIVHRIIDLHRAGAPLVASEQWRLFFECGDFDKYADTKIAKFADDCLLQKRLLVAAAIKNTVRSAARVQMLRTQVVGQLSSWIGNRKNEYRAVVEASSLDAEARHKLHTINQREAWFTRLPVLVHGQKIAISQDVRRLARRIMNAVMRRHRRPSWAGLSVQLDAREAKLLPARKAMQGGQVDYWLEITAAGVGKATVPLCGTPPHRARIGALANTIQISRDRDGVISFGLVTDVTKAFEANRENYRPRIETIAADFGLRTLLALDDGSLLGRDFIARLSIIDKTLTGIARHVQRGGGKPRDSKRYRHHAERVRGTIRTEIGRVFNRLVKTRAPGEIVLESLDFSSPTLSRRMNRILQNCGRSVIKVKLQDLLERFGITSEEVSAEYTSQACSSCGHVHKSNRQGEQFHCKRCGLKLHADVNAARNIAKRRSLAPLDQDEILSRGKYPAKLRGHKRTLERLRQDFERRHGTYGPCRTGGRGPTPDSPAKPIRFAWDEVKRAA